MWVMSAKLHFQVSLEDNAIYEIVYVDYFIIQYYLMLNE